MFFDPIYFLYIAPALLLAAWAQIRLRSTYAEAQRQPAPLSGAAAARHILDSAGLADVRIEQTPGHLSDHYDPRHKVLRLSPEVYQSRSQAAVGIAAHEAGHAIQDAHSYLALQLRNAAVPIANIGSNASMILLILGLVMQFQPLILLGIVLFGGVVLFQVINLPVEFDATRRAKAELVALNIIHPSDRVHVDRVLNAAAWTYVAATLQAILTMLYLIMRFGSSRR